MRISIEIESGSMYEALAALANLSDLGRLIDDPEKRGIAIRETLTNKEVCCIEASGEA